MVGVDFWVLVRHRWRSQFGRNLTLRRNGEPNGKKSCTMSLKRWVPLKGLKVKRISRVPIGFRIMETQMEKGMENGSAGAL